jgi:cyanate permease
MLGGGYMMSALSPVALGVARDATGGFTLSLWILGALAGLLVPASLRASRRTVTAPGPEAVRSAP